MTERIFDEMICPDCGGKIDAAPGDPHKPCRCFAEAPTPPRTPSAPRLPPRMFDGDGDADGEADVYDVHAPPGPPKPAPGQKVCRVCGKDLTGKPRLKDSEGYLCKPCADVVDEQEASLVKCPECERRLKPEAFVNYRGTQICRRCWAFHQENDKVKVGKVDLKGHEVVEREKIKKMLIVLGVLVAVIVLGLLKTFVFRF